MFSQPYSSKAVLDGQKRVVFSNARLVDPATQTDISPAWVLMSRGQIVDFGKGTFDGKVDEVIDCQGRVLCPGLIDIQVHFRDPGQTHKEDVISGSMSAVSGGITTVVCQPNTSPVLDSVYILDYLHYKSRMEAFCNVLAYAAITKNMAGTELTNIEAMASHPIVAGFTDDGLPVMNAGLMRAAFEASARVNLPIAQHAEDLNLSAKGCMNEGQMSAKLGVRGIPNISESIMVQRDISLLRVYGGSYHVLHVSTREALAAIRIAKREGLDITCEVSPHHLTLTDDAVDGYNCNAKMNPPLRSNADILALQEGLFDGTIDAIATDHAPHDLTSKERSLQDAAFGIVGVETMLPIALEFYHSGQISLVNLLATMTCNAAKIIRRDSTLGKIGKNLPANLTIFDPNLEWTINTEDFQSKSKNSPFSGRRVRGKAVMTVVGGVIVFDGRPATRY